MTCIVGIVDEGRVWLGADSAGVGGYDLTLRKDPKVFRNGAFIFGFTTSFRMGQLLRYSFDPPELIDKDRVDAFMAVGFIDAVRECLRKGGYASKKDERETGGTFLVGVAGRLFRVEDDYQVGESLTGYDACGCGEPYARGALYATKNMHAENRINIALRAAEAHSAGVRGPFVVEVLQPVDKVNRIDITRLNDTAARYTSVDAIGSGQCKASVAEVRIAPK